MGRDGERASLGNANASCCSASCGLLGKSRPRGAAASQNGTKMKGLSTRSSRLSRGFSPSFGVSGGVPLRFLTWQRTVVPLRLANLNSWRRSQPVSTERGVPPHDGVFLTEEVLGVIICPHVGVFLTDEVLGVIICPHVGVFLMDEVLGVIIYPHVGIFLMEEVLGVIICPHVGVFLMEEVH